MGWIDVEDSLPSHRKTLEVADDLDIEPVQLVGHLTCFWLWATNNADNNGLLGEGIRPKTIARAAMWNGDAARFVEALRGRFIDVDDAGRVTVHAWGEHFGKFAEKREKETERKREWRAQQQNGTGRGQDAEATKTGDVTIPDLTGPNRTESSDTECHEDSQSRDARKNGAGPDEPSARPAPTEKTDPPAEKLLPFDFCPCCRVTVPTAELEPHFQAHVDAGEIPPQPFGAVQAFLSGRSLRPRHPPNVSVQPDENPPPDPDWIKAEDARRRAARAAREKVAT